MQAGGCLLTIAIPTTAKAIRKPGKSGPASSRSRIQGLSSETSPKKSASKTKPSATSLLLGPRAEGFAKADFFGASSVASALDLRTGRDPDTKTFTLACSFRSAAAEPDGLCAAKSFLWTYGLAESIKQN
jgi:hypothetical protein